MSVNVNANAASTGLFSRIQDAVNSAAKAVATLAQQAGVGAQATGKADGTAQGCGGCCGEKAWAGQSGFDQPAPAPTQNQPGYNDLVFHPGQDHVTTQQIGTRNGQTSSGGDPVQSI